MEISSILIAGFALIFSIVSFYLHQKQVEKHATASVRPILRIKTLKYINKKAIILKNSGIGPAIIKYAIFKKNGYSTNEIVKLFDLKINWETFLNLPNGTSINPQEEMTLILETKEHLMFQGYSDNEAINLLEEWQKQKSGININIEYEDIYGNSQEPLEYILN